MINTSFHTESDVLHTRWQGAINRQDIVDFLDFLLAHTELPRHLYTLEEMENVSPDFEVEELEDVAAKMISVLQQYKTIRSAVVSTDPLPVAYGMMYKSMTEAFPNYKVEIFDAMHLAQKWLEH